MQLLCAVPSYCSNLWPLAVTRSKSQKAAHLMFNISQPMLRTFALLILNAVLIIFLLSAREIKLCGLADREASGLH
jgi:hypothetical protein